MLATGPLRVLVLGGRGYFGRRVVTTLRLCQELEVTVNAKRGGTPSESATETPSPAAVDLARPETFEPLTAFDIVVNCADTLSASPAAGARYVLREGGVWMDMGADPATTQQLLALNVPDPKGRVVVGVGLSPGLLTMLGRYVAELVSPCERIDLGIRLSTLSGAGRGSCRVMVQTLRQPGLDFAAGKQRERPAFGDARPLPYLGTGLAASTAVTLPDTVLVRRVSQAPAVASHLALFPSWLRPLFFVSQWVVQRAGPLRELVLASTYGALIALRSLALRWLGTRVQLTAVANAGSANETVRALDFPSGAKGTALGTTAVVLLWRDIEVPPPGTHSAADLFGLDEALVRLTHAGLAPPRLIDPTAEFRSVAPGSSPL